VQELERLEVWLAELGESQNLSPRLASRLDLCLTEIVTNAIVHGYAQLAAPQDAIIVRFARQGDQVICHIEDRGAAFDPLAHALPPLPASLDDAPIGGSGLRLVRDFADRLDYRREGDTNHLTLSISG
jgi:serine/threonine-protein kinase RsbW